MSKFDFSGWVTKNDLKCSDGRVIRANAFAHNDGETVPLVYNHNHNDISSVVGNVLLENRDEGVYGYGSFNDSVSAQDAKAAVMHGDITHLSIYANQLRQNGSNVIHGAIKEVSLVLAGANPGACIENLYIAHSADDVEIIDEEANIWTDSPIELPNIQHSEEEPKKEENKMVVDDKTIGDVLDTLNPEQKQVVEFLVGKAVQDTLDEKYNDAEDGDDEEGDDEDMKHNVFDNEYEDNVMQHAEEFCEAVVSDAKRFGSIKESFIQHSADYGVDNIDWLMPEYKNIDGDGAPGFVKRTPDAWVDIVQNGVHHTPFSKVKMMFADLREDEARAKGYAVKGRLKKEEVFGLLKRQVSATTIYKKQKFDRDDVIEITSFDIISWIKGEMRMMLNEELSRAILFGDGRSAVDQDKISETNIIPVWKDADFYCIKKTITPDTGESVAHAIINGAVKAQDDYEGSGNLTCFMTTSQVSDMLLMEDKDGYRLYKNISDLALAMSVDKIVKVPASIMPTELYAVILDLKDYNIGADKGGAIAMFDDFDIDYNQMKYLIETRCSGALTKPFSAIALKKPSSEAAG